MNVSTYAPFLNLVRFFELFSQSSYTLMSFSNFLIMVGFFVTIAAILIISPFSVMKNSLAYLILILGLVLSDFCLSVVFLLKVFVLLMPS